MDSQDPLKHFLVMLIVYKLHNHPITFHNVPAGDRSGTHPDELHPPSEHRGGAAHHRPLPQHACVGGRTLFTALHPGCELQGLDWGEDPGWRPPGAARTQGRLLGTHLQPLDTSVLAQS